MNNNNAIEVHLTSREHLLAVVEPTGNGDSPLDLAHEAVASGGRASLLLLITDRVEQDIRDFADAEDLDYSAAETLAIEQFSDRYKNRVGADVDVQIVHVGRSSIDLSQFLSEDVTTVAVPYSLVIRKQLHRLVESLDRQLVVTPDRSLAAAGNAA